VGDRQEHGGGEPGPARGDDDRPEVGHRELDEQERAAGEDRHDAEHDPRPRGHGARP
jgi:hypothetical protein